MECVSSATTARGAIVPLARHIANCDAQMRSHSRRRRWRWRRRRRRRRSLPWRRWTAPFPRRASKRRPIRDERRPVRRRRLACESTVNGHAPDLGRSACRRRTTASFAPLRSRRVGSPLTCPEEPRISLAVQWPPRDEVILDHGLVFGGASAPHDPSLASDVLQSHRALVAAVSIVPAMPATPAVAAVHRTRIGALFLERERHHRVTTSATSTSTATSASLHGVHGRTRHVVAPLALQESSHAAAVFHSEPRRHLRRQPVAVEEDRGTEGQRDAGGTAGARSSSPCVRVYVCVRVCTRVYACVCVRCMRVFRCLYGDASMPMRS